MDIGSIAKDTLNGVFSTLAVMIIVNLGKHIFTRLKRRRTQPKEVLPKTLRSTEEYQDIRRHRQTHKLFGFGLLTWLLVYSATLIFLIVYTKSISFFLKFENLGFYLSLLCLTPMELYTGYSPITPEEVEQKRQANRMRKLKEAQGAVPFGYIFQEIIFPFFSWLYLIFCIIFLILLLTLPPPIVHIPLSVVLAVSGLAIVAGLYDTYIVAKKIYRSLKNLSHVARKRQDELRQQFTEHEFD
jgi:hypothetical protein